MKASSPMGELRLCWKALRSRGSTRSVECVCVCVQANKDLHANILTSCEWDEQSISLLCTVLATFLAVLNYFKINSF